MDITFKDIFELLSPNIISKVDEVRFLSFQEYYNFNHEEYLDFFLTDIELFGHEANKDRSHGGCPYRGIYHEWTSLIAEESTAVLRDVHEDVMRERQ